MGTVGAFSAGVASISGQLPVVMTCRDGRQKSRGCGISGCGGGGGGGSAAVSAFSREFGAIDADSAAGWRVREARPVHETADKERERASMMNKLELLSKKDALAEKAYQCTSMEVTGYKCRVCNNPILDRFPKECKEQSHQIVSQKVTKRWFACRGCTNHISVVNKRLPDGPCAKCHKHAWEPSGPRKAAAMVTPAAEFQPRGEEHGKFRNSAGGASIMAAHKAKPGSEQGSQAGGAYHNAFASSLPQA
jgi:hypothetical protein